MNNEVIRNILTRRSIRSFEEKPVPRDVLELLVKCGYSAPTGHNMQTWKFTVIQDEETVSRLKTACEVAAKENNVICYGFENPQALILISNDQRNRDGCQDASCAAENIMLAAKSLGLGSVWINVLMALRDAEPVKAILDEFGVPKKHIVWAMVALGYPATDGVEIKRREDVVKWV